jgi:hypothetical protein
MSTGLTTISNYWMVYLYSYEDRVLCKHKIIVLYKTHKCNINNKFKIFYVTQ